MDDQEGKGDRNRSDNSTALEEGGSVSSHSKNYWGKNNKIINNKTVGLTIKNNGHTTFENNKNYNKNSRIFQDEISVLYTNADGIGNKLDELIERINDFQPDVVAICETKMDETMGNEGLPKDYEILRKDRGKGRAGGLCILTQKHIEVTQCHEFDNIENGKVEHLWCELSGQELKGRLIIGIIYRPPGCDEEDDIKLCDLLSAVDFKRKKDQIVVLGDFNLSEINWKLMNAYTTRQRNFLEKIEDLFWVQNVKENTRFRINNDPSLLDLIFTRTKYEVVDIKYNPALGKSDHIVMNFNVRVNRLQRREVESVKRNYNKANYNKISSVFSEINWEVIFHNKSTNDCYEKLIEIHNDLVEMYVPFKRVKEPVNKQRWLDEPVIGAIRNKHRSWKKFLNDRTEENMKLFNIARNRATTIKRKAKQDFEERTVLNFKGDRRNFYAYVRSRNNVNSGVGTVLKVDGSLTTNDSETANVMNIEFQKVFVKEQQVDDIASCIGNNKFDMITDVEIFDAISKLREGKSCGPDAVSTNLIINCKKELIKPIRLLFNKSLQEEVVPELWRQALVVPIFKKGSKIQPLNYRPVSLTCVLCKLMESILKDRIVKELEAVQWFSNEQHGFRRHRSTVTSGLEFYDGITEELDKGYSVDILYFDLEKAFDKVSHSCLIEKLKGTVVNRKTTNWIINYLKCRKQKVVIRGVESEWSEVYSGVPQGSVLGPLLFLIYINDIQTSIKSHIGMFADDTKMTGRVRTEDERNVLKNDLCTLETWANKNGMKFNVKKCCVMHCGNNNPETEYELYGEKLRTTDCEKDLGILVHRNMKFREHITSAVRKANNALGMIYRNFECVNKTMFQTLYATIVRPHLEFAAPIWSPSQQGLKDKIEKVQKRATKRVKQLRHKKYNERLQELNLMTTEYRRERGDMITVHKILTQQIDIGKNLIVPSISTRTRGHSKKLIKARPRLDIRKNFFTHRVVNNWNDLKQEVIDKNSTDSFKKAYDLSRGQTI